MGEIRKKSYNHKLQVNLPFFLQYYLFLLIVELKFSKTIKRKIILFSSNILHANIVFKYH